MENNQNIPDTQATAQSYAINSLNSETVAQYSYQQNYTYAANLMVHRNMNTYEVRTVLMERGMTEGEAMIMANSIESEIENAVKAKANKDMLWGGIWCIGGIIITAATYSGGGTAVFCWGAILFGGIQFVRGMMASIK